MKRKAALMRYRSWLAAVIWFLACVGSAHAWPPEVVTATFRSPADGSEQKTLLYMPPGDAPVPLLVAFHTWSNDYAQNESPYAEWCIARGWAMLHPDLRGPSNRPGAAGSDLAIADLRAAIELARKSRAIDERRIYAVGVSGGGMMTLLAVARMPEVWAAGSAWVPVTDLVAWHAESRGRNNNYVADLERICGGPPGGSTDIDGQYAVRSAVVVLAKEKLDIPLDINTGIHDGHTGSVPVSHGLRAFNAVASPPDRIAETTIADMVTSRAVPAALRFSGTDRLYAARPVLMRHVSGHARITVFDGGHEILHEAALTWLESQAKAAPPIWDVEGHETPVLQQTVAPSGR